MVNELNDINFIGSVYETKDVFSFVLFYGEMHSASRTMLNYLDKIPKQKSVALFSCNIDLSIVVTKQELISVIPSVGIYLNGKRIDLVEKFFSPNDFLSLISKYLNAKS